MKQAFLPLVEQNGLPKYAAVVDIGVRFDADAKGPLDLPSPI